MGKDKESPKESSSQRTKKGQPRKTETLDNNLYSYHLCSQNLDFHPPKAVPKQATSPPRWCDNPHPFSVSGRHMGNEVTREYKNTTHASPPGCIRGGHPPPCRWWKLPEKTELPSLSRSKEEPPSSLPYMPNKTKWGTWNFYFCLAI